MQNSAPHTIILDTLLSNTSSIQHLVYWGVLGRKAESFREVTDLHTVYKGRLCSVIGASSDTYYCEQPITAHEGDWVSFRFKVDDIGTPKMHDVELDHGFLDDIK